MTGQTCTIDASGKLLTVEQEGVSMPADYSFQCVNDYVHDSGRHFEELQSLALGMANDIERMRKAASQCSEALVTARKALMAARPRTSAHMELMTAALYAIDSAMTLTP